VLSDDRDVAPSKVVGVLNVTAGDFWMGTSPLVADQKYDFYVNDFDLYSAGVLPLLQQYISANVVPTLVSNITTSTSIFEAYIAAELPCNSSSKRRETAAVAAASLALIGVGVFLMYKYGQRRAKYQTIGEGPTA
jgi:hypothetical protein